jgi:alkaline phosphatase
VTPALVTLLIVAVVAALLGVAAGDATAKPPASTTQAKNVIVLIGDGMGPEHTELGRLVYGPMVIEALPWQAEGWTDTTSLSGVTWSCAAGTALATGYETYNGWVGMSPGEDSSPVARLNALEAAEARGKATGLVTDVYIQDATPAAFSAHVPDRYMKDEIVAQQLEQGIEVLFGAAAGRDAAYQGVPGVTYSTSLADLEPYLVGAKRWPSSLWGFYGNYSMVYDIDREEDEVVGKEPTLAQLTTATLNVLEKDKDGFFLMVEGGAIDWVAHYRDAAAVAMEVREFNAALQVAYAYASTHPGTLLVVVSDHETGGLEVTGGSVEDGGVDADALLAQSASTEWMWGLLRADPKDEDLIRSTLAAYAGVVDLEDIEVAHISACGEMGISDVLAARANATWGWSGTDEGDHTDTYIPVRAWGPGATLFAAGSETDPVPNETVGRTLLDILRR